MSDAAKSPLASQVETVIRELFDVPPAEARQSAEWLVGEAERWGGGGVALLDWNYQVKKWFGHELKWRSEAERQRFLAEQQTSPGAYESYLRSRNQPAAPAGPVTEGNPPAAAPAIPSPSARAAPAPKPSPPVRASVAGPPPARVVEDSPLLTDEEKALGFELREVRHHPDLAGWEHTLQISLPVLDRPPRLDARGATPDGYRTSVIKILNESDAIFRTRQGPKVVYSHLRWGCGSCWGYATFGGSPAWHPVSDPCDSVNRAVARASVTQENPGVSVFPEKFSSRPAGGEISR